MLVLSRKLNEEIVIGDDIRVKLIDVRGNKIRLGIDAPASVPVRRKELGPQPLSGWHPELTAESMSPRKELMTMQSH